MLPCSENVNLQALFKSYPQVWRFLCKIVERLPSSPDNKGIQGI